MQSPRATASEDNAALGILQASPQAPGQTTGVAGACWGNSLEVSCRRPPGQGSLSNSAQASPGDSEPAYPGDGEQASPGDAGSAALGIAGSAALGITDVAAPGWELQVVSLWW
ncbi:UNVERIFIED_CONTAM: hypothetical protein FKN15_046279 [Acipenser sinensis]